MGVLRTNTITLQGTGAEGMTNAVLASVANNSFWLDVLATCQERANRPEFDFAIEATGPKVMGETIKRLFKFDPYHDFGYVGGNLEVSPFSHDACATALLACLCQTSVWPVQH